MKEWLKMLFHFHKWYIKETISVRVPSDDGWVVGYTRYHLQCTVCGKIKNKDMK